MKLEGFYGSSASMWNPVHCIGIPVIFCIRQLLITVHRENICVAKVPIRQLGLSVRVKLWHVEHFPTDSDLRFRRDHGGFGTRIRKCLTDVQCLKSQTFFNSCAKNRLGFFAKVNRIFWLDSAQLNLLINYKNLP